MIRNAFIRTLAGPASLLLAALATPAAAADAPAAPAANAATNAVSVNDFLDSIGTQSAISRRGENFDKTLECAKYLGARWFRAGVEGNVPVEQYIQLHQQAGLRFSWGLGSGGSNIPKLLTTAKQVAAAGALLAFEGPNEPNNWGVTYQGQRGGGRNATTWLPLAKLQSDLYKAVKSDPDLKKYPVWSPSEMGAETDNVGLQFLTIPKGAGCLMPDGTQYADAANVHNYFYHPSSARPADNKTWNAADPTSACKVDGLYGNHGRTWAKKFAGYSEAELIKLPRVTTETGAKIEGAITEEVLALNILTMYLDQFKRGWSYSNLYLLRDRVDEAGNQQYGFYRPDYSPRKAAVYLHNLTTILADKGVLAQPGRLNYSIPEEPATVHDLLLQKSDGTFELVVWGERVTGSSSVTVHLGGTYGTVQVYDPTVGTAPVQTQGKIDSLTLTLSNHPLIIAIRS